MMLALDPRFPLLWRTPDSLQLGVDDPPVVLESVSIGHERMLHGLSMGLTPEGLVLLGTESGLTVGQVEAFRRRIQPALLAPRERPRARVAITGSGPTVDRLALRLAEAGLEPLRSGRPAESVGAPRKRQGAEGSSTPPPQFAVVVAHFVIDPEVRGAWLRRDVPHLPIVYGDTSVRVGPMIEPGFGPCLYCLELHHRDSDSAWPVLAAQLLGSRSEAEAPFLASEAATLATRIILSRHSGKPDAFAISFTLDAESGRPTRRRHPRHPDCACAGIPQFSESAPRGIGTARSHRSAGRSSPPTTTGDVSVPA